MTKTLRKLNRGQPLEFDNIATKTLIAKIIVYIERLNAFPLRLKKRQKYLLLTLLFSIVLEILASAIKQEYKINDIQIGEKKNKTTSI